ncbi:MAG: hypothetical protein IPM56_17195 [Ignavibacteriales bacterium]|nr:MAG: hypothetical protein IPM56_17195 [Ignavibacteriales bacterium]
MKILFVFLSAITGFFIAAVIGGLTQSREAGLAGGAAVFLYSIAGFVIGIIISVMLIQKIKPEVLKKILIILAVINLMFFGWMIVRVMSVSSAFEHRENSEINYASIKPALSFVSKIKSNGDMGLGMAKPDFYNKRILFFYSHPEFEKSASEHFPSDSIVFSHSDHHQYDISYAPPWFYPAHQKMDYEILFLKIITLANEWVEVEVNRETGQSVWISSSDVEIILWQEFLLKVFSVENPDPKKNPLRVKPLLNAGLVQIKEYSIMSPVLVKDNWIKVILYDDDLNKKGEGWIQWHEDGKLLVSYSLLS